MKIYPTPSFSLLCATLLCVFVESAAAEEKPASPKDVRLVEIAQSSGQQFCDNIKDVARERRYAIKTKELNELRDAVERRIAALEKKRSEFEVWMNRRDEFAAMADSTLIDIYSKMRPDAAAGRLEMINDMLAASILMKLSPRVAGVILNEMKAQKAADITRIIASGGKTKTKTKEKL